MSTIPFHCPRLALLPGENDNGSLIYYIPSNPLPYTLTTAPGVMKLPKKYHPSCGILRKSRSAGRYVLDRLCYLFRAISLGIVNFKNRSEQPKILLDKSWKVALIRSVAIHFLPSAVSITLVWINIEKYFIGGELQGISGQDDVKLGALQVAAKIQELLIVASLGTVVMHVVRSELIHGDGLPLGFIMSGWSFATLR